MSWTGEGQRQTAAVKQSRHSIADIWGLRTPYKGQWPFRVGERILR